MIKTTRIAYCYSSVKLDTGSPRALLQMIDSLDRARFTPVFIAMGEGPLIDAMKERDVEIVHSTVSSVSLKNLFDLISAVLAKMRLLKRISAGILHMNEPGWNTDIVLAARLAGIPVALHLHNPYEVSRSNLNFRIARRIFLCSKAQSTTIGNFQRIEDKSVVLHNAVDTKSFARGHPIRESIGLSANDLVIGTVAQISHRKGIDIFLDAAERLLDANRKLKFVIVGPRATKEEAYFRSIMARLGQTPLKDSVIYLGSRRDIPNLFASFDIFCLATRAEPFGMVIIEAMAAGVPVVASGVGGIPEIITSRDIGRTVGSLTPDAFALALDEVLHMGVERKKLGERGRLSVLARFDLAHMGLKLAAVYGEMLA